LEHACATAACKPIARRAQVGNNAGAKRWGQVQKVQQKSKVVKREQNSRSKKMQDCEAQQPLQPLFVVCAVFGMMHDLSHGLWLVLKSEAIHLLHTFCN
jgi:hypothetical protein